MVKVDLKGIKKVKEKGRKYYYEWSGGKEISGEKG